MMFVVAGFNSEEFAQELASEAALMLLPIAVGDAARSRADRIQDLIDTEAAARVQAERIRIARDLHDVVAHGLSTIAIQSGVAAHLLDRDPGPGEGIVGDHQRHRQACARGTPSHGRCPPIDRR